MAFKTIKIAIIISLFGLSMSAQSGSVAGTVLLDGETIEYAQVAIESSSLGAYTNKKGVYTITDVPYGEYEISASFIGYATVSQAVTIGPEEPSVQIHFELSEEIMQLDDIVITGTKTFKRKTESPVIVNVINNVTLNNVQACNLSEGLKFQPGLRVETDCQTCNYTQLRMNGLAGGYSQILINGRPVFSPLTGLYGLEQVPANMIDRIEVVRGGGSSLYGSSAVGGTVNVITRIPSSNNYSIDYLYQNIAGQTSDHMLNGSATIVADNKNSGISFLLSKRDRDFFDANNDNYSEIPDIENTSVQANMFFLPTDNQKIELSISNINEYRYGGEMIDGPAFRAEQAEERNHNVWMANADYQIKFNQDNSSFLSYVAWQCTDRKHYTGIRPEVDTDELQLFIENPPYGTSDVSTLNAGVQLDHRLSRFMSGHNTLSLGLEYIFDDVIDDIPAYNYRIDQTTKNTGLFLQSDWQILPQLTLLSGVRLDNHNLMDRLVLNPRASLLYKYKQNTQLRFSYGTGFRAPQAFDTDLHIAFSGGGISRVIFSEDLREETSESLSASINYDLPTDHWIMGFTVEGFYTRLRDAFVLQPIGEDSFGELFEKQNGDGATVQGLTLELRGNYNKKIQLEGGMTLQTSRFDNAVAYIDEVEGIRDFIRTPNEYGFAILTLSPSKAWTTAINYVYTGKMKVPHFAGAPNQDIDEIISSPSFSELSIKSAYRFNLPKVGSQLELYGGIKNIFNAYQDDFDIGKDRDSNFVYGPGQPRTVYAGVKMMLR